MDEIECNIDEDVDNERYTGKNINDSFINKIKDFSAINPSGNKGKEKGSSVIFIVYIILFRKKQLEIQL
jgi:hypothetical protein